VIFTNAPLWFPERFASSVPANMRRSIRTTVAYCRLLDEPCEATAVVDKQCDEMIE